MQDPVRPVRRKASFLQTMKAIFWSFFGVRKGLHSHQDEANLNPIYVVLAGVVGALLLIVLLLVIVKIVLAKSVSV